MYQPFSKRCSACNSRFPNGVLCSNRSPNGTPPSVLRTLSKTITREDEHQLPSLRVFFCKEVSPLPRLDNEHEHRFTEQEHDVVAQRAYPKTILAALALAAIFDGLRIGSKSENSVRRTVRTKNAVWKTATTENGEYTAHKKPRSGFLAKTTPRQPFLSLTPHTLPKS